MKLLHITFHFEYSDQIEAIMDRHAVQSYAKYPMIHGKDAEGKHFGSQAFPGNASVVQAQVSDEKVDKVLDDLRKFRDSKRAHQHLQALVFDVEKTL